jgi:hypothetical protein
MHTQDDMIVTIDRGRLPAVVGIYVAEGWWREVVDEARQIAGAAWPVARITVEFTGPAIGPRPDPAKVAAAVVAAASRLAR